MSTAIPPAPPPAQSAATAAGGPVVVAVVANGAAVADLADGAMVEAVAQARAAKGVIEALTANGTIQLKAGSPLPPIPEGANLLLQVVNTDGEALLRLLAINGRPLAGLTLPTGMTLAPGMNFAAGMPFAGGLMLPGGPSMGGLLNPNGGLASAPAGALVPGLPAAPGAALGLTATILRPAFAPGTAAPTPLGQSPTALTGGLAPDLPAGTQITVRIAGVGMHPTETAATMPGLPNPGALPGTPAAATAPPAAGFGTAPTPSPAPSPPLLSGTVTAQPPGGHALVQTPIGTLTLPTQMDLPTGTALTLEVVGKPLPPPPAAAPSPARPEGLTPQGWPALTEAMNTLSAGNQAQAMEQLLRIIPQAGPRLAASMALFAGGLRSGDGRALLPETALRGLEKTGKKDLAERLSADLDALADESGRPVGNGEWRGFTMPFLNGAMVDPIQLFVRGAGAESSRRNRGGSDQRFVLDLKLSQLGRVQMDGLVRREDKLFDLIIRTDSALPQDTRHGIMAIFTNSSELVGTKGSVSFQAGGRWVEFPPAPPAPTRLEV